MHIRFSFHQNQNEREDQEVTLAEQQRENYFIDFSALLLLENVCSWVSCFHTKHFLWGISYQKMLLPFCLFSFSDLQHYNAGCGM